MSTSTAPAAAVSSIPSALEVTAPSAAEARHLDEHGFVILPGIMDDAWRQQLGRRLDELEGAVPVVEELKSFQVEPGTARLANLVDQGPLFDRVWSHPRVLGCVAHILQRPFKLSSLNAREPKLGLGHQGLHADWGPRVPGEPFHVANSLWLIDEFTADNGATRLVPGSHLLAGGPGDEMADTGAVHPRQVQVRTPAGSVVVFNAHCWHGGTVNRSGARRRVIHSYFTAREQPQQQDQRKWLSPATKERLDPARRWLLDL